MLSRLMSSTIVVGIRSCSTSTNRCFSSASSTSTTNDSLQFKDEAFAKKHLAACVSKPSILWKSGSGAYLIDSNDHRYLDFTCGIGVTNTGHSHPHIVKAVKDQVERAIHLQMNAGYHQPMIDLSKKLLNLVPKSLDTFFYMNSGAEAVENAVKIARQYTKRPNIITFQGSFHGRTIGTMSMTNSKTVYRTGFAPLMSGVFVAPYAYCAHCRLPKNGKNVCCNDPIEQIEHILHQQTAPSETAAIVIEPVLGEGGVVVPPRGFLSDLRALCDRHNILLVADEVQSGYGRTGKMFAVEHSNVVPDILVMAKGIASGFPLSAIATRAEIMNKMPASSIGGTYGGNAVSCAAAVATLEVFENERLCENAAARGNQILSRLQSIARKPSIAKHILEARGLGLFLALEFQPHLSGVANDVVARCRTRKLLTLTSGAFETVRLLPPLIVTEQQANEALDILESSIDDALRNRN